MSPTCLLRCPKFGRCHFQVSRAFRGSDGLPFPFPAFSEVRRMCLFFFRRFPRFGRSRRLSSDVFRVSDEAPDSFPAFSDRRPRYTLLYIRARGAYLLCNVIHPHRRTIRIADIIEVGRMLCGRSVCADGIVYIITRVLRRHDDIYGLTIDGCLISCQSISLRGCQGRVIRRASSA